MGVLLGAGLVDDDEDLTLGAVRLMEEEEAELARDELVSQEELVSSLALLRASCLTYIGLYAASTHIHTHSH